MNSRLKTEHNKTQSLQVKLKKYQQTITTNCDLPELKDLTLTPANSRTAIVYKSLQSHMPAVEGS